MPRQQLYSFSLDYLKQLYDRYQKDRNSIPASWDSLFANKTWEQILDLDVETGKDVDLRKEFAVQKLIDAYRTRGHLIADTNPIGGRLNRHAQLDLVHFGLSEKDLDTKFVAGKELELGTVTLREILARLKKVYTGKIAYNYSYIRNTDTLRWLQHKAENDFAQFVPTKREKLRMIAKLNQAVVFENFLQAKYPGQKRFGLEGLENTITGLDALITHGAEHGVEDVVIGMAHRGRLNVLANILAKTYSSIFGEFEGKASSKMPLGDGDVKYHLDFYSEMPTPSKKTVNLSLLPNPSHLETVGALVLGATKARQERLYNGIKKQVLPIIIHGDAAMAGQGLVYETLQMTHLAGYGVGGSIHLVMNNQVGFTASIEETRSSDYCTDLAALVQAPVIHINADDPEAVVFGCRLASEFRQTFQNDVFVNIVGYRRLGHNEGDEPKFTQPLLYEKIAKHPNARDLYLQKLRENSSQDAELADQMDKQFRLLLESRLNDVKQRERVILKNPLIDQWKVMKPGNIEDILRPVDTSISERHVEIIKETITHVPPQFTPLNKAKHVLDARQKMIDEKNINWATAEHLAYGSLLLDGFDVRLSGEDSRRGTFSHRHAMIKDIKTNDAYIHLQHLNNFVKNEESKNFPLTGNFQIHNSHLSEYGVLGYEFGYSLMTPKALVLWEAQFGDFANGAQIIIDQYISSSETKWQKMSGLVLLLPHGNEGQGPEHSSAHPERYLSLTAKGNWTVCNLTTPANLFHFLRRQMCWSFRKPAILLSPKSMFRHPLCMSSTDELLSGGFVDIYDDDKVNKENSKRIILCTGKFYYDLLAYREGQDSPDDLEDVALIRVEQVAPLNKAKLDGILSQYPHAKNIVWAQEENANFGYWDYWLRAYDGAFQHKIECVARTASASPATGFANIHKQQQQDLVKEAFGV